MLPEKNMVKKEAVPFQYQILGTSHVAEQSVKEIEQTLDSYQPDIVCVELDKGRLQGLLSKQKANLSPKLILHVGVMGYIFALAGHFAQQKIGKKLRIMPGSDMLAATKLAGKRKLLVALIDQDIRITLKRVSKCFSIKERFKLVGDIIQSVLFPKRAMKKMQKEVGNIHFDLRKVPENELIEKMILQLKKTYPGLHKALVHERNIYMANQIVQRFKKNPYQKILAVVGAGHKDEMIKMINQRLRHIEIVK